MSAGLPRPEACAVVLIDLQVGALAATATRPSAAVAAAAGALAGLAALHARCRSC